MEIPASRFTGRKRHRYLSNSPHASRCLTRLVNGVVGTGGDFVGVVYVVVWFWSLIWAGTTWLTEAVMDERAAVTVYEPPVVVGSGAVGEDTVGDGSQYLDSVH